MCVANPQYILERNGDMLDVDGHLRSQEMRLCLLYEGKSIVLGSKQIKGPSLFHRGLLLCMEKNLAIVKVVDVVESSTLVYGYKRVIKYEVLVSIAFLPAMLVFQPELLGALTFAEEFKAAQYGGKALTNVQAAMAGLLQQIEFDTHTEKEGHLTLEMHTATGKAQMLHSTLCDVCLFCDEFMFHQK